MLLTNRINLVMFFLVPLLVSLTGIHKVTAEFDDTPCVFEGTIHSDDNWHGYIANFTLRPKWSNVQFLFTYPAEFCCQNVLFYTEDQLSEVRPDMDCWEKENILPPYTNQVMALDPSAVWSGCRENPDSGQYVCDGRRAFSSSSARKWYMAVSNCDSQKGLDLTYMLLVSGMVEDCQGHHK